MKTELLKKPMPFDKHGRLCFHYSRNARSSMYHCVYNAFKNNGVVIHANDAYMILKLAEDAEVDLFGARDGVFKEALQFIVNGEDIITKKVDDEKKIAALEESHPELNETAGA